MSIAGYPTDPGDRDRQDDGRATPAGPPPDDWNAKFTAIVSGLSGEMRWVTTTDEPDTETGRGPSPFADRPDIPRAPDSIWTQAAPDTADDRRLRREMRRRERAEALAAFQQEQAEREAELASDTEHYVPPPPPPLPKPRRRTVGAVILMVLGLALIVFPALLPAPLELIAVLGLAMLAGGIAILLTGMRSHRGGPGEGWDDGAQV